MSSARAVWYVARFHADVSKKACTTSIVLAPAFLHTATDIKGITERFDVFVRRVAALRTRPPHIKNSACSSRYLGLPIPLPYAMSPVAYQRHAHLLRCGLAVG